MNDHTKLAKRSNDADSFRIHVATIHKSLKQRIICYARMFLRKTVLIFIQ